MSDRDKMTTAKIGYTADRPYWMRHVSVFVRAIHQIGAAVFLGSYLLSDVIAVPRLYLLIAMISGIILLAVEGVRHRQFFRETFGLVTFFKLIIIGLAYHLYLPPAPTVLFAFFLASIVSHAPKSIRHRLLL